MVSLRKRLGRAIRQLRENAGQSQESFADAVGLHRTYIGSVERGERNLSLDNIARIAAGLGISASKLLMEAERSLSEARASLARKTQR